MKNIFLNFIPHETILCDNKYPLKINNKTEKLVCEKNTAYQSYIQNVKNTDGFYYKP